jgi:hypothetical protein
MESHNQSEGTFFKIFKKIMARGIFLSFSI